MVKKDTLKKNFTFQLLYQALILIIPLIQAPFLTRTIGDEALGVYTYVNSIAYYFVLLAMLGIERHGQRIIASAKDETELRKRFWSLLFVHIIFSLISLLAYIILIPFIGGNDTNIYLLNIIYVASALFNITFLFYGLEIFKNVVIKNLFCKIAEFILILCLVRSPDDLWIYTLITTTSLLLGNLILFPSAVKLVKPIKFNFQDCKMHLKPLFVLSISVIASSLYTVFNKTLIGLFMEKNNVAYYEYANKIINIPKSFIAVIGTVFFPRSCAAFEQNDKNALHRYSQFSILLVSLISFSTIFGIIAVGDIFVDIYYGHDFIESAPILMAMTPLIFIIGLGDVIRNVFLIPMKKDTYYVICVVLNSVVNLVVSFSLIFSIGVIGVVIGTICAELFGLIFQYIICRKELSFKVILKNTIPYLVIGLIMFIVVYFVKINLPFTIRYLILEIFIGAMVFGALTITYIFLFNKEVKEIIFKALKSLFKKSS